MHRANLQSSMSRKMRSVPENVVAKKRQGWIGFSGWEISVACIAWEQRPLFSTLRVSCIHIRMLNYIVSSFRPRAVFDGQLTC
jgi:hypothetical protein